MKPRTSLLDILGPWLLAALFYGGLALYGAAGDLDEDEAPWTVTLAGPHDWHPEAMSPRIAQAESTGAASATASRSGPVGGLTIPR